MMISTWLYCISDEHWSAQATKPGYIDVQQICKRLTAKIQQTNNHMTLKTDTHSYVDVDIENIFFFCLHNQL